MERISSNSTPSAIPSWRIMLCCGSGVVAFGLAGFGLHSKGAEIREEVYAEKPQTAQETSWLRTIRSELWEKKVVIANRSFFCQARQKREEPAIPRRLVCLIGFVSLCALFSVALWPSLVFANNRPASGVELVQLLHATINSETATAITTRHLDEVLETYSKDDISWPSAIFISAELHLMAGRNYVALKQYQQLAEWGAESARDGGWGGSALATFALWRWLTIMNGDPAPNANNIKLALNAAELLMNSRFAKGLFRDPALESIPNLEVEIKRQLAIAAERAGLEQESINLFIDYLQVSNGTDVEESLLSKTLELGYGSKDRIELLRGKRLFDLNDNNTAAIHLKEADKSENPQVRAEAKYYLSEISRRLDRTCDNARRLIPELDTAVRDVGDPVITQRALMLRAMLRNSPKCRDSAGYIADLSAIAEKFPDGGLADNALYLLARHFESRGDLNMALKYYADLRAFKGPNDYENFARFRPALLLYAAGKPSDLSRADELLTEIIDRFPDGDLYLAALFWRGRIASETAHPEEAKSFFERVIERAPFSYYAIRARMHLNTGNDSSFKLLTDPLTAAKLQGAFRDSILGATIDDHSLYSQRLRIAIESGLYREALRVIAPVSSRAVLLPLKVAPIERIETEHAVARLAVLLSSRQDALAAKDLNEDSAYLLKLAGALGQSGMDWPMALRLIFSSSNSNSSRWAAQKQKEYLATAYPPLFDVQFRTAASKYQVPASLLHAIVLQESSFNSDAVSISEAAGLFQFIPRTFWDLNEKWKYLPNEDEPSRRKFLFDPGNSIDMGARWVSEILIPHYSHLEGKIVLAVMEHSAGKPAVDEWIGIWKSQGRLEDIEFLIDTILYQDTRRLVRETVATMLLVEAAGLYREKSPAVN